MKILVIGGAGFIGSNLVKELIKENDVYCIDNYFTGSTLNHVERVEYIRGEAKDVSMLMKNVDIDIVFHFGEYSRVEQSFSDIKKTFELNQQVIHVLEYCKEKNAKLIYSGSSTKFSDESSNLCPYAWTKVQNTQLIKSYSNWFNLNYAIVYFYNVYGSNEISSGKYATLIAKFAEMYKRKEPLTVTLPGTQRRNFTHVDDIISALILVSEHGLGDNYGIGSDISYSIDEVAKMFTNDIVYSNPKRGNRMSAPVISEKTKELGWSAKKNLFDYISELKNND